MTIRRLMRTLSLVNELRHIASHAPDRSSPSFVETGTVGGVHGRLEQPLPLPCRRDAVEGGVHSCMEAGEVGGSEGGGFCNDWALHRQFQDVGEELHQPVVL